LTTTWPNPVVELAAVEQREGAVFRDREQLDAAAAALVPPGGEQPVLGAGQRHVAVLAGAQAPLVRVQRRVAGAVEGERHHPVPADGVEALEGGVEHDLPGAIAVHVPADHLHGSVGGGQLVHGHGLPVQRRDQPGRAV